VNFVFSVVPHCDWIASLLNATGVIQHEQLDGCSPDQMFVDESVLSGAQQIEQQIEPPTFTGVWGNDIVRPSICQRFLVWG